MATNYPQSSAELSEAYDRIKDHIRNNPQFYVFVAGVCTEYNLPKDSKIIDFGCGKGFLLKQLSETGYTNLSGVDFSKELAAIAVQNAPAAVIATHDLLSGPVPDTYEAAFLTEVVEHLTDPVRGLQNIHASLTDEAWLFLTFPNRRAYFPWYYAKPVVNLFRRWPAVHRRLGLLFVPYEMRTAQPIDHSYRPKEVAAFLEAAGFEIIGRRGHRLFPMWRFSRLPLISNSVEWIEQRFGSHFPTVAFYRYMFVCRRGPSRTDDTPTAISRADSV